MTAITEETLRRSTALLPGFSIEVTAKDAERIEKAAPLLPPGTQVSVTSLPGESIEARVNAASVVRRVGLEPMSHIAARGVRSESELRELLDALRSEAKVERVFVIAGEVDTPAGPYNDALAVLRSGVLAEYGIKHVGISGYPEGHPTFSEEMLWAALRDKTTLLKSQGLEHSIITQFGFDAEAVLNWMAKVRAEGIDAPVRVGISGPASVKTLLAFAARCGVGASAKVMKKYGLSITKLLNVAGPDPIIRDFASDLNPDVHGKLLLHFYPFGGVVKTAQWIQDFKASAA